MLAREKQAHIETFDSCPGQPGGRTPMRCRITDAAGLSHGGRWCAGIPVRKPYIEHVTPGACDCMPHHGTPVAPKASWGWGGEYPVHYSGRSREGHVRLEHRETPAHGQVRPRVPGVPGGGGPWRRAAPGGLLRLKFSEKRVQPIDELAILA